MTSEPEHTLESERTRSLLTKFLVGLAIAAGRAAVIAAAEETIAQLSKKTPTRPRASRTPRKPRTQTPPTKP